MNRLQLRTSFSALREVKFRCRYLSFLQPIIAVLIQLFKILKNFKKKLFSEKKVVDFMNLLVKILIKWEKVG